MGADFALNPFAVIHGHIAGFHHGIHEEAQTAFGRQTARAGMGRKNQSRMFEIRHHIADRGRRQRGLQQTRQMARANRLARRQITLDNLLENVTRTLIEVHHPQIGTARTLRQGILRHQNHPNPNTSSIILYGKASVKKFCASLLEKHKP